MLFFSRWPGTAIANTSKFVGVKHKKKKTFGRRQCIPKMRFFREDAYSSVYWLIWRLRRPRFQDMPQISCTTCCDIQTFGFVNASILCGITGQYSGEPIRMKYLAHVTRITQSDCQISTFHSIRHL